MALLDLIVSETSMDNLVLAQQAPLHSPDPNPHPSCLLQELPPTHSYPHPHPHTHTWGMCLITEAERILVCAQTPLSPASEVSALNLGNPWSCSTFVTFPGDRSDQCKDNDLNLSTDDPRNLPPKEVSQIISEGLEVLGYAVGGSVPILGICEGLCT